MAGPPHIWFGGGLLANTPIVTSGPATLAGPLPVPQLLSPPYGDPVPFLILLLLGLPPVGGLPPPAYHVSHTGPRGAVLLHWFAAVMRFWCAAVQL